MISHSTVVVVVIELTKLLICYVLMAAEHESGAVGALQELWTSRRSLRELTLPALSYTGQNNLLFVAVSSLSASASQVLTQTKVLWTAVFARALMHTKYSVRKWASFLILMVGSRSRAGAGPQEHVEFGNRHVRVRVHGGRRFNPRGRGPFWARRYLARDELHFKALGFAPSHKHATLSRLSTLRAACCV